MNTKKTKISKKIPVISGIKLSPKPATVWFIASEGDSPDPMKKGITTRTLLTAKPSDAEISHMYRNGVKKVGVYAIKTRGLKVPLYQKTFMGINSATAISGVCRPEKDIPAKCVKLDHTLYLVDGEMVTEEELSHPAFIAYVKGDNGKQTIKSSFSSFVKKSGLQQPPLPRANLRFH